MNFWWDCTSLLKTHEKRSSLELIHKMFGRLPSSRRWGSDCQQRCLNKRYLRKIISSILWICSEALSKMHEDGGKLLGKDGICAASTHN